MNPGAVQGKTTHSKPRVILTRKYQAEAIRELRDAFDLIIMEESGQSLANLLKENPDTVGLISFLSDRIDGEIMDLGVNLKIIANYAVGYNNIDVGYAVKKGIPVTNTPGVLTESTADFTMALMLAACRRVVEGDRFVREGKFRGWGAELLLGKELNGAVLGIVGLGRIGLATARRARAFGMKVIYYSRTRNEDAERRHGFEYVPLDRLLQDADVVSLHVPATPDTRHMFDAKRFDLMKEDAVFINASRGDLVKEADLADKLERCPLFSAGLDVYEFEPEVTEKLKGLDNVVLAPHLGSATHKTRLRMAMMTVDNVKCALAGLTPPNLVKEWAGGDV